MAKDIIDILLVVFQFGSLIFLIVYVAKTWEMASATKEYAKISEMTLQEMKETRDEEYAPYIVVYFDYSKHIIELVVKNLGKTVARNVKLCFDPPLKNSRDESFDSLITDKIYSIPPGYEIRTFFDLSHAYFGNESLPLLYVAKVEYFGGNTEKNRKIQYTLDINHLKNLSFLDDKGMDELVKSIEKIEIHQKKIADNTSRINSEIKNGIWIKNPVNNFSKEDIKIDFYTIILSKLDEFRLLWFKYENAKKGDLEPFRANLRNEITVIANQLIEILSNYPHDIDPDLFDRIGDLSFQISELGRFNQFTPGYSQINSFRVYGKSIMKSLDALSIDLKKLIKT